MPVSGLVRLERKIRQIWNQGLMRLQEHHVVSITIIGILLLLVASPVLSRLLVIPRTEFFTEFWILDSNHQADNYPFNITRNQNYAVFLGIANHLGFDAHYVIEVKFRNKTQSIPNSFTRTPSSLPARLNITAFVADEGIWELPLTFCVDYEYNKNLSQIEVYNLTLTDVALDLRNYTVAWDSRNQGFFNNLFFELWIYNDTISNFQYHERFTGLWLNMTV